MPEPESRIALLAGASGFLGSHVLNVLLEAPDIARVFAVTRRPLEREHVRLANRIVQFAKLEEQLAGMRCHVALCCLGTTLAAAGSQQAFRQVNVDFVLAFARAARAAQAQRFVVVSAAGANPRSTNFHLRVKGELEDGLASIGFPSLDIMQPGLLLGWPREMRPAELLGRIVMPVVNPFLIGAREVHRAIPARTVAQAMLGATRSGRRGVYRYTYRGIRELANLRPVRPTSLQEQGVRGG